MIDATESKHAFDAGRIQAAVTTVALVALLATPASAGGPSLKARVARLQRSVSVVSRLAISTNNQVHKLQRAPVGTADVAAAQTSVSTDGSGTAHGDVQCPTGRVATGGGAVFQQTTSSDRLIFSHPYVVAGVPTGWEAAAQKGDGGGVLLIEAICELAVP